ncbi:hypothetical protein D3C77_343540 [compost metagenome]
MPNMFYFHLQRNELLIFTDAYAQQLAERYDHLADAFISLQHSHGIDRFQGIINKMRIDLRHERLQLRLLLPILLGLDLLDQLIDLCAHSIEAIH